MIYLDVTSSCKSRLNTGVQRVVRGTFKTLTDQGFEVTPLVWSHSHQTYCFLSGREKMHLCPSQVERFRKDRLESARNPYPWSKATRWISEKVRSVSLLEKLQPGDFLYVPEVFQDSRTELFSHGRLPAGVGLTAFFHDALGWSLKGYETANDRSQLEEYLKTLARFQRVLCNSKESEADLHLFWKSHAISPAPTVVVPLPMPLPGPRPPGLGNFEAREILCVASQEARKNHLVLLEACERLWRQGDSFRLVLVGRSIAGKSEAVVKKIGELQKSGRDLSWLQHIDDLSLAEAYAHCSFTAYPSVREGFGLPILESLWHGRPCVCGGNGALGEAAEGGGCVLVNQTNPEDLARGLHALLNSPELYVRIQNESKLRHFRTWEEYVHDLLTHL